MPVNPDEPITTNRKPKLLIVDDQVLIIRVLHELFKDSCDIYMAHNGLDAIEKCTSIEPDLILLDVVMPKMDGYEVCKILKANEQTAKIPIIFITGSFEEADELKGFELGAVDFIRKPINAVITRARVNNHLALKKQTDLLRSIALIDGLTGIANRRRFEAAIHTEWLQSVRDKSAISLLMIDIDEFKKYNDHYGHLAGDDCLKKVAQAINEATGRPYDLTARYGGEEFVVILPKTNHEGAQLVAKQIMKAVRDLNIPHEKSAHPIVTISIGVTTMTPEQTSNFETLITTADQALYKAKSTGRNTLSSIE